jgi:hypothetical protein
VSIFHGMTVAGRGLIVMRWILTALICLSFSLSSSISLAFPDSEVLGPDGDEPPFNFLITSTLSGFVLISDARLAVSYGETLELIDMGKYQSEQEQPPALSSDDETDGIIGGIAYDSGRNQVIASQEDGDLLFFDLSDITATPFSLILAEDKKLGRVTVDSDAATAYVANNGDMSIHIVDLGTRELTATIPVTIHGFETFNFTDAVYVENTAEVYFATDAGVVFYIARGAVTATGITGLTDVESLTSISPSPDGTFLYITNDRSDTDDTVIRVSTSSHAETNVISLIVDDRVTNTSPTGIVITEVTNPSGTYAYMAGSSGVTVIETGSDTLKNMGGEEGENGDPIPVTYQAIELVASSSSDGYIYTGQSNLDVGMISANPLVTISSLSYSDEESSLGTGGSFTLTFMSDQTGTYEIRAGGSVDAGGSLLTDEAGATTGTVDEVDQDISVTVAYDTNAEAFAEGENDLWVFVTNGDYRGRIATTLDVDTPPPSVVISSTGFGNSTIYVTFDNLNVADISAYHVYADVDSDVVLTKTEIAATVTHTQTTGTQTATVSGLTNGVTYYIAMDAEDAGGNVSLLRTGTYASGGLVSEMPEATQGPLDILGEGGCAMTGGRYSLAGVACIAMGLLLVSMFRRRMKALIVLLICLSVIGLSSVSALADTGDVEESDAYASNVFSESPQWWSFEVKTGFWMPQNKVLDQFFGKCCNMWSRMQGGLLVNKRYGAEFSAGFLYDTGYAVGATTGRTSQDKLTFMLVPMELSFVWRADYFTWRYIIPYVKAGGDAVFYRQKLNGASTKGMKYGMHGVGGLQINIGELGGTRREMDSDYGINDMFLTLEAEYKWINNFGGKGLDLSGQIYSIGFLFEF